MRCRVVLPSETYAYKAQRILAANGYSCEMVRVTSPRGGCQFGLSITGDCEQIQALLQQEGIPVQSVRSERGTI